MGQVRHGSAATTHAVRAALQRSQASIAELSRAYGLNPKTVAKWRRTAVADAPLGPREPRSTVLSLEEEALAGAFRLHMAPPLDDRLDVGQATIPSLSRSALHRRFRCRGISCLPEAGGDRPGKAF
jgi:transposase-like protein